MYTKIFGLKKAYQRKIKVSVVQCYGYEPWGNCDTKALIALNTSTTRLRSEYESKKYLSLSSKHFETALKEIMPVERVILKACAK